MKSWLFSLCILLLWGCAAHTPPPSPEPSPNPVLGGSPASPKKETPEATVPVIKPVFKKISPLETHRLSLSLHREDALEVFYLLAREAGLNLVISKEVNEYLPPEARLITAEFHDYTIKEILDTLCRILDLHYEIKEGVIYVGAFQERIFDLSFLQTLRGAKFNIGGDVLGGVGGYSTGGGGGTAGTSGTTEFVSPLQGRYEVTGETARESTDIYKQLEASLKALLSKEGTFTLNRLTGNLYVRDHPSRVRRVAEFVERLKKRYSRQVLIEAKIVEVDLSRGHDLGIDWVTLRDTRLPTVSSASLDLRSGMPTLTFSYQHKPSFEGVLKLLERYGRVHILSNPRIRVLHGQPALISVGRSVG